MAGGLASVETRRVKWVIRSVSLFLLLLISAYYVWPTPYSYSYERVLKQVVHVRTHRITGETFVATDLAGKGWRAGVGNPFACRIAWQRLERSPGGVQPSGSR